jgi:gamma-D-glutamyl-L-lysine dipeptidyl-peptidase
MEYAMVIVPAAPVRKKARHQSEMTNQLLFGETVKIIKTKSSLWVKVRSLHDQYEGWMTNTLLLEVEEQGAMKMNDNVASDLYNSILLGEATLRLPFGATLPGFGDGQGMIKDQSYQFNGKYSNRSEQQPGPWLVKQLTSLWLNAPYMWGGRTIFGVDCSGFVQIIYKVMGINLPRDAWQQAQEGHTVKKLKDAVCGDLVFFDDKEEIVHVGILLNNEQIIHASGKVRIDKIDKKGIINTETGKRTHQLEAIKRYW